MSTLSILGSVAYAMSNQNSLITRDLSSFFLARDLSNFLLESTTSRMILAAPKQTLGKSFDKSNQERRLDQPHSQSFPRSRECTGLTKDE